ncbi:MAG TPA: ABC transporter permease subunit [Bacillota bacterium]|nr:ABC transporter permease subunit [Bacillota bacterium]
MKRSISLVLAILLVLALVSGCAEQEKAKMATIDDLADKRIGVYTGTIYDKFAVERFPNATILRYNSISDFVLALKDNKIDAAISNLYSAKNVMKVNSEIGILTDEVLTFPIGIGFNKKNSVIKERFNRFLKGIKADGSFDAIYQKWFENDPEKVKMPKFPGNPAGEKVVLGVAVGDLPNVGYINGEYVGFDIELIQTFAQKEKLNLEIVTMEFGALVAALAAGKVDMITDCLAITKERQAQIDFSDPHMEDKSAVIALKSNLANVAGGKANQVTIAEIAQKRVGVLQGSVHDSYMAKNYPDTQVLQYKSYPDLILAVKSGKVDAGFITSESFKELRKTENSVELLVDKVFTVPIGMGFNKENNQLRGQFNAFLKEIKANGVYNEMIKRWYKDGSAEMPVIENPKTNGKLIVGNVSDKGLPYTIVKNNRLIGSDIELVERFAAYLGKEIEYADMDFGNLIAAVRTNKIDMITSTLMITEERKKQIAFSDPYYELSACVFGAVPENSKPVSFIQSVATSFYNNIILENRYLLILDGFKTTIVISIFSILFGTLLGALICMMRMARQPAVRNIAKVYIALMRGLPVLVLLMLIFYVVFAKVNIDPVLVAVVAFGINFGAYVSEMFRTAIESIDKGQTEAGIAGGFTKTQTFIYIVIPQAIRQVLPVYKGELISLVKMTSIVGYIAVQDLTKASDIIRSRTFDAFFPLIMTAVLYFAISAALLLILNTVERRIDPKGRRKASRRTRILNYSLLVLAAVILAGLFMPMVAPQLPAQTDAITKLEQLDGKRVCVITGTTGDFAVRKQFEKAKILDMAYPADAALAVQTKKADAFAFDKATLQYLVNKNPGEFAMLPGRLDTMEVAIPVRPDNQDLLQKLNAGIAQLKVDGTLDMMTKKWFWEYRNGEAPMPKITLDGKNGTLKMGTCLLEEPFAFVSNGEKVGFDIELAYRLAEILGVKLEISDMSYDGIIAGLQAGKIDMALANFYKMPDERNTMTFSDTYLESEITVLVRREKQ